MRRKCLAIVAMMLSLQMTGCGTIHLTTQEKNVIAEYIANILLKHDMTYEPTLQYDFQEDDTEEKPVKEEIKKETDVKTGQDTDTFESTTKEQSGKEDGTDMSSFYPDGVSVSSDGYSFYQEYPKKTNAILPIEASSGNTICVVKLKIKNTTSSRKRINFLMKNYSYQLEVDSGKTYSSVQSLLTDDIQYLDVTLKPGKSHEAIAVFEIPKSARNKKLKLLITKGSKVAGLKLK